MKDEKICGTCGFHEKDGAEWACVCVESEYCADYTPYDHTCECWEGKE